jgi:hypothetical protein
MKCVLRQRRLALMTSHVARDLKRSSDVYRGQDVIGESCFERKYESNINYCLSIVVFRKLPGRLLFYSLPLRSYSSCSLRLLAAACDGGCWHENVGDDVNRLDNVARFKQTNPLPTSQSKSAKYVAPFSSYRAFESASK